MHECKSLKYVEMCAIIIGVKAEIISVGTEILVGSILNSNQQYLSQQCAHLGLDVYTHSTIGDNPPRLADALETALMRSDLVITTGGLGPTADDITLKTAADVCGFLLTRHQPTYAAILKLLNNKKSKMTPHIARQALAPAGASVFPNRFGTAPGILAAVLRGGEKKYLLLLPGPPRELSPMFEKHVYPALRRLWPNRGVFRMRSLKFSNRPESDIAVRVDDLLNLKPPVTMGIYARPGEVELKIMSKAPSAARALNGLKRIEKAVLKRFPGEIVLMDEETLEERLGALLMRAGKTLSVAESCTGGALGSLITNVAGSSGYFLGGVAAYQNRIKSDFLGVSERSLKKYGAVSFEVAEEMAEGARKAFRSDFAAAITGIAGPGGGTAQKPVGLVFIAAASVRGVMSRRHFFIGKREDIKAKAAKAALLMLVEILSGKGRKQPDHGPKNQVRV